MSGANANERRFSPLFRYGGPHIESEGVVFPERGIGGGGTVFSAMDDPGKKEAGV